MANESLISKILLVSIVAAGIGASALPLRSDPPAPGSRLTGQDYADFWLVAEQISPEEQARLILITEDNRILPAYDHLLDGWIITEPDPQWTPIPHPDDPLLGDDTPAIDIINGDIPGEVIVIPPGFGGGTGGQTTTGGGISAGGTSGSTGSGGGTSGASSGGLTSGGTTGGWTTSGTNGSTSTSGSTTGGTSTGGTSGTTGSSGATTGTIGATAGGGGTPPPGGTTGDVTIVPNGFWNWEESHRSPESISGEFPTFYPGGSQPHDSGFYRRVLTKRGFGQIRGMTLLTPFASLYCPPLAADGSGEYAGLQFAEVPHQYFKLDFKNSRHKLLSEAGFKYERHYISGALEPKAWKPYMTVRYYRTGASNPGGIQVEGTRQLRDRTTGRVHLRLKSLPLGNSRTGYFVWADFYDPAEGSSLPIFAKFQFGEENSGPLPASSDCEVAYMTTIAQASRIKTLTPFANGTRFLLSFEPESLDSSPNSSTTALNTGAWFLSNPWENVRVGPITGTPTTSLSEELTIASTPTDPNVAELSLSPHNPLNPVNSRFVVGPNNRFRIFTGARP